MSSFEKKLNSDGSMNPKYIDLLDEDKTIAGQKFTCISFVSPENVIKNKEIFMFNKFIENWDLHKSCEKYMQFLNFVSYKYNLNFNSLTKDFEEFCQEEKAKMGETTLSDDYKNFMDANEDQIEEVFNTQNNFQTSVRGIKVRGVFESQPEAELRCKLLREADPHHDVFVGPVGMWMPWEPNAYKTGRVEHLEEELNQLMQEKKKNEDHAKREFDKRVRETKEKAIEENKKLAQQSGNKLTQNIDKNGNLYSINTQGESAEISVADVKKEMFEGDNIATSKENVLESS